MGFLKLDVDLETFSVVNVWMVRVLAMIPAVKSLHRHRLGDGSSNTIHF
jgi:hypothetical protein